MLTIGVSMVWQISAGVAATLKTCFTSKEHLFISLYVQNIAGRRRLYVNRLTTGELETVSSFARSMNVTDVAIMFDDIVVAPELGTALTDYSYSVLLQRHDELVRDILEKIGSGEIIKSTGNGLLIVFNTPTAAVETALAIQKSYRDIRSSRVRIGIGMGSFSDIKKSHLKMEEDNPIAITYAIMRLSPGEHILTDKTVFEMSGPCDSDSVAWHCFGTASLKGGLGLKTICEVYDPRYITRLFDLQKDEKISDMRDIIDGAMISRAGLL
ncbi:MAG: hypothetical protein QGH40_17135 [bacterium]|nr:hypothetical protein [bacterium]